MIPAPHNEQAAIPDNLDICISFVLFGNAREEIERAIGQARSETLRTHIVLIDNSQPPLDLAFARAQDVTVITTNANLGYGRGHNIALAASKGRCRYNLVMNTDLQMGPDVMPGLVTFMDAHEDVGLTMPKVRYPDGSLQRLCRLLPEPADLLGRRFFSATTWARERNRRYEFHEWDYNTVAEFPFLSGCFMMIRRCVLDTIGYFDERYFLYAEDLDLSRRIHAVARTLYVPEWSVVHEYRSQTRPSLKRLRYALVSLAQYFTKWGWLRDPDRARINRKTCEQFE